MLCASVEDLAKNAFLALPAAEEGEKQGVESRVLWLGLPDFYRR
jgi:hypothetical protein